MKTRMHLKYIFVVLLVIQLVLVCATIHDVGRAQGLGLYLALQTGSAQRLPFDLLVDACGTLLFGIVLLVPFRMLRYRNAEALFELSVMYLAFMPVLDMAMLIHLFDGRNLFTVAFDWGNTLTLLSTYVRKIIPVLGILYYVYQRDGHRIKKWHKILALTEIPVCMGMFFLQELSQILFGFSYYLLVILAFDWWESAKKERTMREKVVIGLIFGALFFRGFFKMLKLMSMYQL